MTTEDAIRILSLRDNRGVPISWQNDFLEAVDLAIEALREKSQDEITVGDEVTWDYGTKGIIIDIYGQYEYWVLDRNGCMHLFDYDDTDIMLEKTGRSFKQELSNFIKNMEEEL